MANAEHTKTQWFIDIPSLRCNEYPVEKLFAIDLFKLVLCRVSEQIYERANAFFSPSKNRIDSWLLFWILPFSYFIANKSKFHSKIPCGNSETWINAYIILCLHTCVQMPHIEICTKPLKYVQVTEFTSDFNAGKSKSLFADFYLGYTLIVNL